MKQIDALYAKTKQSLDLTHRNNPDAGILLIREVQQAIKALKLTNPQIDDTLLTLEVIALNNLACAYNKKGKFKAGLFNLQQARAIESQLYPDLETMVNPDSLHQVATTHSNMCALLSQMGEHEKALKEIAISIELLQRTKQTANSDALMVFYYNSAIEFECISKLNEAKKQVERGLSISKRNPEMKRKLSEVLDRLNDKIKFREERIGNYLITHYKNTSHSHNELTANNSKISKEYSSYMTRMPRISPTRHVKQTEYPVVRLPAHARQNRDKDMREGRKDVYSLGLGSRKKVISLYETASVIPGKNRRSLSKKKQSLQKLCSTQL